MSTPPRPKPDDRPPRNKVWAVVDITVGAILAFIGVVFSFGIIIFFTTLHTELLRVCGDGDYSGITCGKGYISAVTIIAIAIAVFSAAITGGLVIVNALRKRVGWYWPLIGMVITYAAFWAGAALVALAQP